MAKGSAYSGHRGRKTKPRETHDLSDISDRKRRRMAHAIPDVLDPLASPVIGDNGGSDTAIDNSPVTDAIKPRGCESSSTATAATKTTFDEDADAAGEPLWMTSRPPFARSRRKPLTYVSLVAAHSKARKKGRQPSEGVVEREEDEVSEQNKTSEDGEMEGDGKTGGEMKMLELKTASGGATAEGDEAMDSKLNTETDQHAAELGQQSLDGSSQDGASTRETEEEDDANTQQHIEKDGGEMDRDVDTICDQSGDRYLVAWAGTQPDGAPWPQAWVGKEALSDELLKGWEDTSSTYEIEKIVRQKGQEVLIRWAGTQPNGKPWPLSWEHRVNVTDAALEEWDLERQHRRARPDACESRKPAKVLAIVGECAYDAGMLQVQSTKRRMMVKWENIPFGMLMQWDDRDD